MSPKKRTSIITDKKKVKVNRVLLPIKDNEPANESKNETEKRQADAEEKTAYWTKVLAIFTIVLTTIGIGTAIILNEQSKTLKTQILEMRDEARTSQRAWVAVFNTGHADDALHHIFFKIDYKNTGNTPALETRINVGLTDDIEEANKEVSEDETAPSGVLPPNVPFSCTTNTFPTPFKEIIKRRAKLFVYGTIWYKDISGNKHKTEFCFVAGTFGADITLFPDGKHNSAD